MKVSELIKKLQKLQEKHGDLEVMSVIENPDMSVGSCYHEELDPSDYPSDWNMPTERIVVS